MKEPKYVKLYGENLGKVKGITGMQFKVFYMMIMRMDDNNMVYLRHYDGDTFIAFHGIAKQTFNNAVSGLVGHGVIKRTARGAYRVSKKYAEHGGQPMICNETFGIGGGW